MFKTDQHIYHASMALAFIEKFPTMTCSLTVITSYTTTGTPLQQHIDALSFVLIRVAKVYTNGFVCVVADGVARVYNNVYRSVGNLGNNVLQGNNGFMQRFYALVLAK